MILLDMETILETERMILRPFTMDDVDAAFEMNSDPEVNKYTHDGGVQSREEIERRIREDVLGDYKTYGYGRFAVIHKADDRFIGFQGLKYLSDLGETDLGYRFVKAYWGQGLATESGKACIDFGFNELELERIICIALEENKASFRVMEKLGFTYESAYQEGDYQALKYVLERPVERNEH